MASKCAKKMPAGVKKIPGDTLLPPLKKKPHPIKSGTFES